jgi:hypothetical protein
MTDRGRIDQQFLRIVVGATESILKREICRRTNGIFLEFGVTRKELSKFMQAIVKAFKLHVIISSGGKAEPKVIQWMYSLQIRVEFGFVCKRRRRSCCGLT